MRKRETERQRERERGRERERERQRERERGSHTATASRHHREGEESLGSIFVYVYIVSNGTPLTRNNGAGDGFQRTVAGFGVDVFVSSACVSCLNKNTVSASKPAGYSAGCIVQVVLLRYMHGR